MLRLPITVRLFLSLMLRKEYCIMLQLNEFRKFGKICILGGLQVDFCELWKTKFVTFKSHNGFTDCYLGLIVPNVSITPFQWCACLRPIPTQTLDRCSKVSKNMKAPQKWHSSNKGHLAVEVRNRNSSDDNGQYETRTIWNEYNCCLRSECHPHWRTYQQLQTKRLQHIC